MRADVRMTPGLPAGTNVVIVGFDGNRLAVTVVVIGRKEKNEGGEGEGGGEHGRVLVEASGGSLSE